MSEAAAKQRIFIVEDEALVAMELADRIRRMGFTVCGSAQSGEAALEAIPRLAPSVILMDIHLGPGMNGIEVASRLQGVSDAAVVFVTAFSDPATTSMAVESRSFAYVTKPYQPHVLRASIEMALYRRDAEAKLARANAELDRAATRYRALFENAIEGIFRTDLDGTVHDANPAFARMLGHASGTELVGTDLRSVFADRTEAARIEEAIARRTTLESTDARWRRRDGKIVVVELSGRVTEGVTGCPRHFQGFVRDVTDVRERALRETLLLAHKEQLELVLEGRASDSGTGT